MTPENRSTIFEGDTISIKEIEKEYFKIIEWCVEGGFIDEISLSRSEMESLRKWFAKQEPFE